MAKYRVAVATNDGENVNVHFGHAASRSALSRSIATVRAEMALAVSEMSNVHPCSRQQRI